MAAPQEFILGEFPRTLDERYRLSIPAELVEPLAERQSAMCILAKERPGCLSLWNAATWQARLDEGVELVKSKMRAGKLEGRLDEVQQLSRLLSTRHKTVQLAGRGRLSIPDGFREFLQVEQGGEVIVVGAGVCVEIWNPRAWLTHLESHMPRVPTALRQAVELTRASKHDHARQSGVIALIPLPVSPGWECKSPGNGPVWHGWPKTSCCRAWRFSMH